MARRGQGVGFQRLVSPDRAIAALEVMAEQVEALARRFRLALVEAQANLTAIHALRTAPRAPRGRRGPGRPAGRRSPRGAGAGAAAWQVLKEWGRSARSGELLEELTRRGVAVGGQNPKQTLNSTLLKYPGIAREGRGLFYATGDGPGTPAAASSGRGARKAARAAKGRGAKGKGRKGKRAEAAAAAEAPAEAAAQS